MKLLQQIFKSEKFFLTIFLTTSFLLQQILADETITIVGDELDGPNVCKRIEEYKVEVVVSETVPYQDRINVWCWQVPPSKLFCYFIQI